MDFYCSMSTNLIWSHSHYVKTETVSLEIYKMKWPQENHISLVQICESLLLFREMVRNSHFTHLLIFSFVTEFCCQMVLWVTRPHHAELCECPHAFLFLCKIEGEPEKGFWHMKVVTYNMISAVTHSGSVIFSASRCQMTFVLFLRLVSKFVLIHGVTPAVCPSVTVRERFVCGVGWNSSVIGVAIQ